MAAPPAPLAACGLAAAGAVHRFWSWVRGGYCRGAADPANHRGWLWPLGRLTGLLPISFKECTCTTRAPFSSSRAGSEHAVGEATLPSSWDLPQPGRVTASRCSCVVAERSVPWLAYSFGVVLVLVPSAVYGLCRDAKNATSVSKPSLRMLSPTDVMVTFCDILSVVLCSVVCFAQLALTQGTLFEVLEHLQQVDRSLSVRPPAVPGLLALWLLLLLGVVFTDGHMWAEIGDLAYASTYFPFYIVYFLTFMMEVLFIDDAHGIYMRFAALNEKLDQALALPTYQAATEQQPFGVADGWIGEASRSTAVSITGIADSNGLYSSKTSNNSPQHGAPRAVRDVDRGGAALRPVPARRHALHPAAPRHHRLLLPQAAHAAGQEHDAVRGRAVPLARRAPHPAAHDRAAVLQGQRRGQPHGHPGRDCAEHRAAVHGRTQTVGIVFHPAPPPQGQLQRLRAVRAGAAPGRVDPGRGDDVPRGAAAAQGQPPAARRRQHHSGHGAACTALTPNLKSLARKI